MNFLKALRLKKVRRCAPLRFSGGEKEDASAVKILVYSSVINAQELGTAGVHVRVIMLALGTFAIDELENGIISRSGLNDTSHHLKQSFPKMWGTLL